MTSAYIMIWVLSFNVSAENSHFED